MGKRLSYGLATFLWLVSVYEVALVALRAWQGTVAETPVVGALFAHPQWTERAAPVAILVIFGWVLLEAFLHWVRILREQSAVQKMGTWGPGGWSAHAAKDVGGRAARERAQLAAKHIRSSPGQLREVLPAAAALDAQAVEGSFTMAKALVWALPVLGFIGTAWGMAHAIGGFAEALKETRDIAALADRLGQLVIPGLAAAFSTTILALASAMVGHLCLTALESWNLDVLQRLDRITVDLLAALPAPGETAAGPLSQPDYFSFLLKVLEEIKDSRTDGSTLAAGVRELMEACQAILAASDEMERAARVLREAATLPYHITVTRDEVASAHAAGAGR